MPAPKRKPARLKGTRDEHVFCHAFSHQWDDISAIADRGKRTRTVSGVYIVMRCLLCGTQRRDTISPFTGSLLLRQYTYPDGYAVKVDKRRGTKKEQMRREYIARRG
jgi:hypothetical protein